MDAELKEKMNEEIDEVGEILVVVSEFTGTIYCLIISRYYKTMIPLIVRLTPLAAYSVISLIMDLIM